MNLQIILSYPEKKKILENLLVEKITSFFSQGTHWKHSEVKRG
jgi:hypothetical protein